MDELGKRLQTFRLRNGWSKRSVAERLGVSTPSIMRWEEGSTEPNDYNRYKIERFLNDESHPRPDGRPKASPSIRFSDPPVRETEPPR